MSSQDENKIFAWHANADGTITAYMSLVEYTTELGDKLAGNTVFPSVRTCRENRPTDQVGIIELEIKPKRIVAPAAEGLLDEVRQYRRSWTQWEIPVPTDTKT